MIPPTLLAGISGNAVRFAVIGLLIVGILLGVYFHGRRVAEGEIAEAQRDIAVAYAGRIVELQGEADRLASANATIRASKEARDRIITKEIVRYETATPPVLRCALPGAWRLLHDAAATGEATPAAGGSLAAADADPVADTAALATVADNYAACREAIEQLKGWQRRYNALESPP